MAILHRNEFMNPEPNDIYVSATTRAPGYVKTGVGEKLARARDFSKEAKLIGKEEMKPLHNGDYRVNFPLYAEAALHAAAEIKDVRQYLNNHNSKEFQMIDQDLALSNIKTITKLGIKDTNDMTELEIVEYVQGIRSSSKYHFECNPNMLKAYQSSKAESHSTATGESLAIRAAMKANGYVKDAAVVFFEEGKLLILDGNNGNSHAKDLGFELVKVILVLPPKNKIQALELAQKLNEPTELKNRYVIEDVEKQMQTYKEELSTAAVPKVGWWQKRFPNITNNEVKKSYKKIIDQKINVGTGTWLKYNAKETYDKIRELERVTTDPDGNHWTEDGKLVIMWTWEQKTALKNAYIKTCWDSDNSKKIEGASIAYINFPNKAAMKRAKDSGALKEETLIAKEMFNVELRAMDEQLQQLTKDN